MGLISEFKAFAMRGNVVDMAVGVIIGGAFGLIITSLVKDIIMPVVNMAGTVDFSQKYVPLSEKARAAVDAYAATNSGAILPLAKAQEAGSVLGWGNFVTITINFLIIAFCIFMVIKLMNAMIKKEEAKPPPPPTNEEKLLTEIRDLLKSR
jgi:large conductance mechanosensitive channel